MSTPSSCFGSIDELSAALKQDDPPISPPLPGTVVRLQDGEKFWDLPERHAFEIGGVFPEPREFTMVEGRRGGSKILPFGDGKRFLYRGQNRRWTPCLASVWRNGQPSDDRQLNWILSRTRIAEFQRLLDQHPLMEVARENKIELDYDALAQHYGIPTFWIDLTSSIDVACFFATARFNEKGEISACDDGTGIVYRVHWNNFEEPFRYFTSISHSPASRPGKQHGWAIGVQGEVDLDNREFVERFDFVHSRVHSERFINSFAKTLFPDDSIINVAQTLKKANAVTMSGIKFALERDGCPVEKRERLSNIWGERLCNDLGLDVFLDEEFALTEDQIQAGRRDAERARESFFSEVCFWAVRTRKESKGTT